ncbi:hypothetical protein JOC37_000461 [Desulfohalotomaculum tongense]|nr:hypothetical protein [Desulforadius tongensis]
MGEVLEFKPRKKRKLKTLKYEDPAKRELYNKRKQQKNFPYQSTRTVKNITYFIILCIIVYFINKII